jgi:hypothetical protein
MLKTKSLRVCLFRAATAALALIAMGSSALRPSFAARPTIRTTCSSIGCPGGEVGCGWIEYPDGTRTACYED